MAHQPKIIYNASIPAEAYKVGPDFKPERAPAPRLGGVCFANMQSAADIESCCGMAPATHKQAMDYLIAHGKVRDKFDGRTPPRKIRATIDAPTRFEFGSKVYDTMKQRKGVIIHANAGYTKRTNQPAHQIADKSGRKWYAVQSDLKLLA